MTRPIFVNLTRRDSAFPPGEFPNWLFLNILQILPFRINTLAATTKGSRRFSETNIIIFKILLISRLQSIFCKEFLPKLMILLEEHREGGRGGTTLSILVMP